MITTITMNPAIDKIFYIDDFEPGRLYRVGKVFRSAGGKGVNVARVASMLGEKVCAAGFIAGQAGRWLELQLDAMGIITSFVEVEGETRTSSNIIDRKTGTETEVLEAGPVISFSQLDKFMAAFKEILQAASILVCSGGLPEGVPEDIYRILIDMANVRGLKTILDSSGDMLAHGILARPYMVKPNLRELSGYVGRALNSTDEIIEACRCIISQGVKVVTVSMSGEGALMVTEDAVLKASAPKIEVVNTIGSGDSMVAGLAGGLYRSLDPEETLRLGMACAAANTQFEEIGFVSSRLIDRFSREIIIDRLE